jgi:Transposase DDE domain
LGRRLGGRAEPYRPPQVPAGKVNTTDPDSRSIPLGFGFVQGYNAQAAVNEQQIVLAAEITNNSTDFSQLDPMVTSTLEELERVGVSELPEAVAADAGYWNEQHIDEMSANKHIPVLIPPDKGSRGTPRPSWTGGRYEWMRRLLATEHAGARSPRGCPRSPCGPLGPLLQHILNLDRLADGPRGPRGGLGRGPPGSLGRSLRVGFRLGRRGGALGRSLRVGLGLGRRGRALGRSPRVGLRLGRRGRLCRGLCVGLGLGRPGAVLRRVSVSLAKVLPFRGAGRRAGARSFAIRC